jgi:SPP1 family predicted phage head-tail adaptor
MTTVFLRAGELDRRIKLQQRSATKTDTGTEVQTWTDVATVWANIQPLSGRELIAAAAVEAETTHMIVIRYRQGVTARMRAVYGSRIFNITAVVEPQMAHVSLELLCTEGLNEG